MIRLLMRSLLVGLVLVGLKWITLEEAVAQTNEDWFRIENVHTKDVLFESSEKVKYGQPDVNDWNSHWQRVQVGENERLMNRETGHYLHIEDVHHHLDAVGVSSIPENWTSSQWKIESAQTSGAFTINNVWRPQAYLHVEDRIGFAQASAIPTTWGTPQWYLQPVTENVEAPNIPTELRSTGQTSDTVRLAWNTSSYATTYFIYRNGERIGESTSASFQDRGLTPETSYTYRVRAVNVNGESELSEELQVSTREANTEPPSEGDLIDYDATDAFYDGTLQIGTDGSHFSGNGYIEGFGETRDRLILSALVSEEKQTNVTIRYSNHHSAAHGLQVLANGQEQAQIEVQPTGGKDEWEEVTVAVDLRTGLNTLTIEASNASNQTIRIDSIQVNDLLSLNERGASHAWIQYQSQDAETNGEQLNFDLTYSEAIQSEASNRQATMLSNTNEFISFELTEAANAFTLRYAINDTPEWNTWAEETISLYIDGTFVQKVDLTSKHTWIYGQYPYNTNPEHGTPHRFFDEARVYLEDTLPAGSNVEFRIDSDDQATFYIIDLLDAERVDAAYAQPDSFLSITEFGAVPNDNQDDTSAIKAAIAEAQTSNRGLWIPEGVFTISERFDIEEITIRGAGMWHSTLHGKGGFNGTGGQIEVYDLSMIGDMRQRDDAALETAFDGKYGQGSTIQHVWIQNTKTGIWSVAEAGDEDSTDGLYVSGLRIKNTFADGINFNTATTNSMVEHTHIRNSGDDALAMFAINEQTEDNAYRFNTVQIINHANGVGIYGGIGHRITDNVIEDTVSFGSGIKVSREMFDNHPATLPVSDVLFARNTLNRTGSVEHNHQYDIGSVWLRVRDDIDGITFEDITINDASHGGIFVEGDGEHPLTNTRFNRISINDATNGIFIAANARGNALFEEVVIQAETGLVNQATSSFEVRRGTGNSGW